MGNYSKLLFYDTSNSHGLSTTIWLSGCSIHCDCCFNKKIWSYSAGKPVTDETIDTIVKSLTNTPVHRLVILGGEPLDINNSGTTGFICRSVKEKTNFKTEIIVYTGYTIESIFDNIPYVYQYIDRIIDGPYRKDLPVDGLDLRGSTNQRCFQILYNKEKMCYNYIEDKNYFKKG